MSPKVHTIEPLQIRKDFPIFRNRDLIYFDNAATTQKPLAVIEAVEQFYCLTNANVHRGIYRLASEATDAYEEARKNVQQFIHATSSDEIVFTRGATEGINLVAHSFVMPRLEKGQNLVISEMEHHSNLIPWQQIAKKHGVELRVIPLTDDGELDLQEGLEKVDEKTLLVALVHTSNSLGTINPINPFVERVRKMGSHILIDAAQAMVQQKIDVQEMDYDFLTFSGHKMFGPTGIGVLYGKSELLQRMQPYQYGGEMIESVSLDETTFRQPPYRFEAGTPNIAGSIGLSAAIDYIEQWDVEAIGTHGKELAAVAVEMLEALDIQIVGRPMHRGSIVSFLVDKIHPHDIATLLDHHHIAIRAGHHCTEPLMQRYDIPGTARMSFSIYNSATELQKVQEALLEVRQLFH
ncbi:MAG: SufS family cysteine desulfurase [Saprospiraceae bacterium]|nr:SufS family cysteine desulfurase [Saprospiraceae bacterium]